MLKSVKDGNTKYQWAQYGKHDQMKCSHGVDAKCSSLVEYVEHFAHPFFDRVAEIVRRLCHSKFDVITDAFKYTFTASILIIRMCILVPFITVATPCFAHIHLPYICLFDRFFFLLQQYCNRFIGIFYHRCCSGNRWLHYSINGCYNRRKKKHSKTDGKRAQQWIKINWLSTCKVSPYS